MMHKTATSGTIAIMQPYFIPYPGYFRLLAASDLFVIYDCVQFPRRGWVHRNKLIDAAGAERWVTLPLVKAPQDVLIQDLQFPSNTATLLQERFRAFPMLQKAPPGTETIMHALMHVDGTPVDYIERLLERIAAYLGLPWNVVRSSSLGIPQSFRGEDRIIEIARHMGARRYVNAPGGRDLYSQNAFAAAGMTLNFLPNYSGPNASILTRILRDDKTALAKEISQPRE